MNINNIREKNSINFNIDLSDSVKSEHIIMTREWAKEKIRATKGSLKHWTGAPSNGIGELIESKGRKPGVREFMGLIPVRDLIHFSLWTTRVMS